MNSHPTYYSGGSGTYAGTQRKLRDQDGNLTGETEMITPETEKRDTERRKRDGLTPQTAKASSSGGEWVNVGGAEKMAANTRPQSNNDQPEQAAGFGEALSSYLSQGGGIRARSKGRTTYTKGALRGMTQDEAVEKAKRMWDGASPAIREKYAARVRNRTAESERNNSAQQPQQRERQPQQEQRPQQPQQQPMAAFNPQPRGAGMSAFGGGQTRPSGDPVMARTESRSMFDEEMEEFAMV